MILGAHPTGPDHYPPTMAAVLGFAFLIGGILAINRALQFLWRPFMGGDATPVRDRPID